MVSVAAQDVAQHLFQDRIAPLWLAGHRLGIELGVPVYQDLNGPQMAGDWMLTVGWQKAF